MAMTVTGERSFRFNKDNKVLKLDDPNPSMSPQTVMDFYSNHYPELLNGNIEGPELGENDMIIYSFSFTPKSKG